MQTPETLAGESGAIDTLSPSTPVQAPAGMPPGSAAPGEAAAAEGSASETMALTDFIEAFGEGLLSQVRSQNPPVYDPPLDEATAIWKSRQDVLDGLKRRPFKAQADAVHAVVKLLVDARQPAAVINAEMGTGKTMMAISAAAVMQRTHPRTLVISPPHLVYKWRREILDTVPDAKVWVLNGPDTLRKLLLLRQTLRLRSHRPEFFVLGRVRMRMGFHWKPAFVTRGERVDGQTWEVAACPDCLRPITRMDEEGHAMPIPAERAAAVLSDKRLKCECCGSPLWTLVRAGRPIESTYDLVLAALRQMPTIGEKTARRLLSTFGEDMLAGMLEDNLYEFVNLMDENGDLVFSDRQAARMERALASFEFSVGEGGYQPTEFIKRYLPRNYFGLLVVDEGHEYKNEGSAQGQAMGVLASQCQKTLLLTGTLMGGYADDLFHLLWRLNPASMIEDGFRPGRNGSMGMATMSFMREHGVLKDIYKESSGPSHRTARGRQMTVRTSKAPGFGPVGIMRYVLPMTVFLKLREIGQKVLPPYEEQFVEVPMTEEQFTAYQAMEQRLVSELKQALAHKDNSLLGVVMNVLLAWPECCFRPESVFHPRTRALLHHQPAVFDEASATPKEQELLRICLEEKARGRKVLAYSIYSGTRDTTSRLKAQLQQHGLKVAVLRASVDAARREDWVADQVERGIDVLICNPELVKTGLDLLEFPTIVFMQSGYNVYTVQQAARRSWRIGQKQPVKVVYLGYARSSQMECLKLMAKKIAVSQSTSGDMPDSGLDVLNDAGESLEVALARKLLES